MSKGRKSKADKNNLIYRWILILSLIAIGIVVFEIRANVAYEVEPRASDIKEAQKKDTEEKKTVSWLRVQGTNIDLPVLYAPAYDFTYEGGNFAWTEADFDKLNNIVYISGHNIKNNSRTPLIADESHNRFEQLMSFAYYDFAKDNQFIQYTINGEDYLYRIYAVSFIDLFELDIYNDEEYTENQKVDFIKKTLDKSIYLYDIDVAYDDPIITLNTCTDMFGATEDIRITVNARLVRKGEKVKLANMATTDNYKTVENIINGGSNDETDEA